MPIMRCELPTNVVREWSVTMSLSMIKLCGREGDLHCQLDRVTRICQSLGVHDHNVHILQPPATLDQKGWHRVTDTFASSGVMTLNVEGGISPGTGHVLLIPVLDAHVLYVENLRNRRVGAARVKPESLAPLGGCCGAENVVQALMSKLEVHDPAHVRGYVTGGGPIDILPRIVDLLGKWGVQPTQAGYDGLRGNELGLGSKAAGRPEQNWVVILQTLM